mmetsp:Transcript_12437/g.17343  ORF Transcript_12437/g.17343 Transcript_12437/m.17343 type:complete len:80 (+) Transcript_12437:1232-1471(+)
MIVVFQCSHAVGLRRDVSSAFWLPLWEEILHLHQVHLSTSRPPWKKTNLFPELLRAARFKKSERMIPKFWDNLRGGEAV